MHEATYSFYDKLYNAGDRYALPDPQIIGADILPDAFRLDNFTQVVTQVIARSSPKKATGLDGVSVADFKALPLPAVNSIAQLFHDILTRATFPEPWLNIKVTLIPKKGGELALKDLRPLSIAPVAYRIWAKTLLILCSHAGANIHPCSVGGIPNRQAQHAFLRVALTAEKLAAQKKSAVGLAIDTQKFFDVIPHALAARCLTEIGVPPVIVFAWLKYITSIRRYISIHNSIADKPLTADRGIPQGDPISMLAAAAALGLWLDDLNRIPPSPSAEAWVFVDDRLLFQEVEELGSTLQDTFTLTCQWDAAWAFNTRPKTVCFRFGRQLIDIYWPDGQRVALQEHPVYLGVPIPLPSFSRASFYQPIVEECCYILRNLITAKSLLTLTQRKYAVAAVVMKKLCYSSLIARLTSKQASKIRSLIMQVVFDKPLACHDAAVALVLQGHMLDYSFAAVYTSISNWHRYLCDVGPHFLLQHLDFYSSKPGRGPVRNLLVFGTPSILISKPCSIISAKRAARRFLLVLKVPLLPGWACRMPPLLLLLPCIKSGPNIPIDSYWKDFSLMRTAHLIDSFLCKRETHRSVLIVRMSVLTPLISSSIVLTLHISGMMPRKRSLCKSNGPSAQEPALSSPINFLLMRSMPGRTYRPGRVGSLLSGIMLNGSLRPRRKRASPLTILLSLTFRLLATLLNLRLAPLILRLGGSLLLLPPKELPSSGPPLLRVRNGVSGRPLPLPLPNFSYSGPLGGLPPMPSTSIATALGMKLFSSIFNLLALKLSNLAMLLSLKPFIFSRDFLLSSSFSAKLLTPLSKVNLLDGARIFHLIPPSPLPTLLCSSTMK